MTKGIITQIRLFKVMFNMNDEKLLKKQKKIQLKLEQKLN